MQTILPFFVFSWTSYPYSFFLTLFALAVVTKSKCSSYVGATGIVIKETKNMFYLITEDDAIRGKQYSLFKFH